MPRVKPDPELPAHPCASAAEQLGIPREPPPGYERPPVYVPPPREPTRAECTTEEWITYLEGKLRLVEYKLYQAEQARGGDVCFNAR